MNIKEYYNNIVKSKTFRAKQFALFGMGFNFLWSLIKILLGVYFFSLYFLITGIYTLLLGLVKRIFAINQQKDDQNVKLQKGIVISIFILIVSLLYTINMSSIFITHQPQTFNLIVSIAIATFSFTELTLGIINFIKARKSKDPLLMSYRASSLISSMFAIVTTQIALLATTNTNAYMYNALTGTIFGAFSVIIAVYVLVMIKKTKNNLKKDLN